MCCLKAASVASNAGKRLTGAALPLLFTRARGPVVHCLAHIGRRQRCSCRDVPGPREAYAHRLNPKPFPLIRLRLISKGGTSGGKVRAP